MASFHRLGERKIKRRDHKQTHTAIPAVGTQKESKNGCGPGETRHQTCTAKSRPNMMAIVIRSTFTNPKDSDHSGLPRKITGKIANVVEGIDPAVQDESCREIRRPSAP